MIIIWITWYSSTHFENSCKRFASLYLKYQAWCFMCMHFISFVTIQFTKAGLKLAVLYPEFFWADQYTHWTHKDTTKVGDEGRNFQNFYLQILKKYNLWLCLFLDFFVIHFPNYLSLHYEKLFFLWIFKKFIYSDKCESCKAIWAWKMEQVVQKELQYRKSKYLRDLLRS